MQDSKQRTIHTLRQSIRNVEEQLGKSTTIISTTETYQWQQYKAKVVMVMAMVMFDFPSWSLTFKSRTCLCACLSVCWSVRPSIRPSVCLSLCPFYTNTHKQPSIHKHTGRDKCHAD